MRSCSPSYAHAPWIAQMLSQVRSVSSGYWIRFKFPMTLIRLIDYPLMGEGARNIFDPANDMPADYIVKAVGGNVHRNAVIVSDSPRILGVLAASGRRDIPLRYALWTEDAWWDQRALPAYLDRVRVCHSWDMAVQSDTRQVVVIRSLPAGPAGEARPGNGEVKLGGFMRGLSAARACASIVCSCGRMTKTWAVWVFDVRR